MSFRDRFRRAAAGVGQALGGRRPGTTLVYVGRPEPLLPPRGRRALPAPEHPLCSRCGLRHESRPLPGWGSGGFSAYGRSILPDPTRPTPLGRGPAHDKAVIRDQVNPWRHGTPDPPPPSLDRAAIREELYAPRVPWWEQRD